MIYRYMYRVAQKNLSFTDLSICRFVTNIKSISPQLAAGSANVQFGKISFSRDTLDKKTQITYL